MRSNILTAAAQKAAPDNPLIVPTDHPHLTTANERVAYVRSCTGLTPQEFAAYLGMTEAHSIEIEQGKQPVTKRLIMSLLHAFGISPQYINTGITTSHILAQPDEIAKYKGINKHTPAQIAAIKQLAKKMILERRMMQKDIAQQLGISAKTLSGWVQQYGWSVRPEVTLVAADGSIDLQHLTGFVSLEGFAAHLRNADPKCYKAALGHLATYLHSLAASSQS